MPYRPRHTLAGAIAAVQGAEDLLRGKQKPSVQLQTASHLLWAQAGAVVVQAVAVAEVMQAAVRGPAVGAQGQAEVPPLLPVRPGQVPRVVASPREHRHWRKGDALIWMTASLSSRTPLMRTQLVTGLFLGWPPAPVPAPAPGPALAPAPAPAVMATQLGTMAMPGSRAGGMARGWCMSWHVSTSTRAASSWRVPTSSSDRGPGTPGLTTTDSMSWYAAGVVPLCCTEGLKCPRHLDPSEALPARAGVLLNPCRNSLFTLPATVCFPLDPLAMLSSADKEAPGERALRCIPSLSFCPPGE